VAPFSLHGTPERRRRLGGVWVIRGQVHVELHNRTTKIESDPHRTRSSDSSVASLGNHFTFSFSTLEPIRVRLKLSVMGFADHQFG
jgi:hypothetical protein